MSASLSCRVTSAVAVGVRSGCGLARSLGVRLSLSPSENQVFAGGQVCKRRWTVWSPEWCCVLRRGQRGETGVGGQRMVGGGGIRLSETLKTVLLLDQVEHRRGRVGRSMVTVPRPNFAVGSMALE